MAEQTEKIYDSPLHEFTEDVLTRLAPYTNEEQNAVLSSIVNGLLTGRQQEITAHEKGIEVLKEAIRDANALLGMEMKDSQSEQHGYSSSIE